MRKIYLFTLFCLFFNLNLIFAQRSLQKGITISQSVEKEIIPDEVILEVILEEKKVEDLERILNKITKSESLNKIGLKIYKDSSQKDSAAYELKLKLFQFEEVINKLKTKGITNISFLRADYSQKEELVKELENDAIKKAKEKAISILNSIGKSIGKLISINLYAYPIRGYQNGYDYYPLADNKKEESKLKELDINLSPLKFRIELDVSFEIK